MGGWVTPDVQHNGQNAKNNGFWVALSFSPRHFPTPPGETGRQGVTHRPTRASCTCGLCRLVAPPPPPPPTPLQPLPAVWRCRVRAGTARPHVATLSLIDPQLLGQCGSTSLSYLVRPGGSPAPPPPIAPPTPSPAPHPPSPADPVDDSTSNILKPPPDLRPHPRLLCDVTQ